MMEGTEASLLWLSASTQERGQPAAAPRPPGSTRGPVTLPTDQQYPSQAPLLTLSWHEEKDRPFLMQTLGLSLIAGKGQGQRSAHPS